jgi:uncharacterized protein (DUF1778 family)
MLIPLWYHIWNIKQRGVIMATALKATTPVRWTDSYTRSLADKIAAVEGQSLNSVIMNAIRFYGEKRLAERAAAMKEFGPVVLSPRDFEALMKNIENPPKPNKALRDAMKKHKESGIQWKQ